MAKAYVMHHAPMVKRQGEIIGSRTNTGLSEYGIEVAHRQARRTAKLLGTAALEGVKDTILSSPLRRALQTSEIIADHCGLEVITDDRLKAQDFGKLDGMTFEEVARDPELRLHLWEHVPPEKRDEDRVPEGESNRDMVRRVAGFKEEILQGDKGDGRPLIITHGTVIDALIAGIEKKRLDQIEGQNRRYEGRPVEVTHAAYRVLGPASTPFNYIPRVAEAVSLNEQKAIIADYIAACTREDERVHLMKLLNFYK